MKIETNDNYTYKVALSNEIDEKFKDDFIKVRCEVFGLKSMNKISFNHKYINNIYGPSILVVVYSNNNPIAARAMWRNDINSMKAYQLCDTCVLEEYRGKGIFKVMTNAVMKKIEDTILIYNFPNQNSYRQYLKLGWNNLVSYRTTFLLSLKRYKYLHPQIIDDDYIEWWLKYKQNVFVYKKGNDLFLVKKRKYNIYFIIGRINPSKVKYFRKLIAKLPLLLYYDNKKRFYNKNRQALNIVVKGIDNVENIDIPIWKMDAI